MIRYALICDKGHQFESWFQDSAAYDKQARRKLVACPQCNSTKVEKAMMAPRLAGRRTRAAPMEVSSAPAPETAAPVAMMSPQEQFLREKLKELRDHVTKNADYVGDKFPDLARQMHYEEIDQRSIYGEAKPDEVKELIEEGVGVQPLPMLPEDKN